MRATPVLALLAVCVVITSYSNLFFNDLVMQDRSLLAPQIQAGESGLPGGVFYDLKRHPGPMGTLTYEPLTWYSLQIDHALFGNSAAGYHLTQLLLHLVLGTLLALLLCGLLRDGGATNVASNRLAILGALLWSVHRLNTSVVERIGLRSLILGGIGLVGTTLVFRGFPALRRRRGWILLLAAALLTGHAAYPLCILLLAQAILFIRTFWPEAKKAVRVNEVLTVFWLGAGVTAFYYLLVTLSEPRRAAIYGQLSSRIAYFENQWFAWVVYLFRFFWPVHVSIAHADWNIASWHDPKALLGLGICFLVTVAAAVFVRSGRPLGRIFLFGWLWFAICLVPSSSLIVQTEAMADQRLYLPMIGLVIMICAALADLEQRLATQTAWIASLAVSGLCALIAGNAWGAYARNSVYRSDETLVSETVRTDPKNSQAWMMMADLAIGNRDMPEMRSALAGLAPFISQPEAAVRRARLSALTGDIPRAIAEYRSALANGSIDIIVEREMALFLFENQRGSEAEALLREQISKRPADWNTRKVLLELLMREGKVTDYCIEGAELLRKNSGDSLAGQLSHDCPGGDGSPSVPAMKHRPIEIIPPHPETATPFRVPQGGSSSASTERPQHGND